MKDNNSDYYWKLAEYDFKFLENDFYQINGEIISNLLDESKIKKYLNNLLELVTNDRRFNIHPASYYECWEYWKYYKGIDPDDSGGENPFMRSIYYLLWGKKLEYGEQINEKKICKNGWENFRVSFLTELSKTSLQNEKQTLWGGDAMNTIASYKKCSQDKSVFESLSKSTHMLGNFVLVPAYFNGWRGLAGNLNDCFDRSLLELKMEVEKRKFKFCKKIAFKDDRYSIAEANFSEFNSGNFNMYINTFFLWDYVTVPNRAETNDDKIIESDSDVAQKYIVKSMKKDYTESDVLEEELSEDTYQVDKGNVAYYVRNADWAIRRRSIFMAAMLYIANEFKENNEIDQNITEIKNDTWKHWQVSTIYKIIMEKVFLTNDCYKDYCEVMTKIVEVIVKVIESETMIDQVKEVLNNAMIRINALEYNNIYINADEK